MNEKLNHIKEFIFRRQTVITGVACIIFGIITYLGLDCAPSTTSTIPLIPIPGTPHEISPSQTPHHHSPAMNLTPVEVATPNQ